MNSNATLPTTARTPQGWPPALLAGFCTLISISQPANAQGSAIPMPAPAATAPSAVVAEENSIPASRFVDPDMMESYLAKLLTSLAMNGRTMDPLGQIQDPNAKPLAPKPDPSSNRRFASAKPTSFTEIISRIKVNTIMPSEERFLIGSKSYKKGDRIQLSHKGRNTEVEVVAVDALKIEFKKVDSGEVAAVQINLLPPGMQQGTDGISTPGMAAEKKDSPLVIDAETNF